MEAVGERPDHHMVVNAGDGMGEARIWSELSRLECGYPALWSALVCSHMQPSHNQDRLNQQIQNATGVTTVYTPVVMFRRLGEIYCFFFFFFLFQEKLSYISSVETHSLHQVSTMSGNLC